MGATTAGGGIRWEVYNRKTHDTPVSFASRRSAEAWRGVMGLHAGTVGRASVERPRRLDAGSLHALEVAQLVDAGLPLNEAHRLAAPILAGTL